MLATTTYGLWVFSEREHGDHTLTLTPSLVGVGGQLKRLQLRNMPASWRVDTLSSCPWTTITENETNIKYIGDGAKQKGGRTMSWIWKPMGNTTTPTFSGSAPPPFPAYNFALSQVSSHLRWPSTQTRAQQRPCNTNSVFFLTGNLPQRFKLKWSLADYRHLFGDDDRSLADCTQN